LPDKGTSDGQTGVMKAVDRKKTLARLTGGRVNFLAK
jgi:hypothetical protein